MQTYDYRENTGPINEVASKIDMLSEKQAKQVSEFIDKVKEFTGQEQISQSIEWTSAIILPILRSFAEITSSLLIVENNDTPIIETKFINDSRIDITENYRFIKIILNLASHISIESQNGETIFTLVFDCTDFIV